MRSSLFTDKHTRGIDISSHQGNIDIRTLSSKTTLDFVIIRVGYGTKGTIDKKFERNIKQCIEARMPYGLYWYSYALNEEDAEKEAKAFLKIIEPYTKERMPEYGCWFDMEDADGYKKSNGMPSDKTLRKICYKWCEMVEDAGYYAGIYASEYWLRHQLAGESLSRFDKWVAQWPTFNGEQIGNAVNAEARNNLSLWQFTSKGHLVGYGDNLDLNYAYKIFPNPEPRTTAPSVPKPEPQPQIPAQPKQLMKGMRVKFIGSTSYSGIVLAPWTKNDIFNVIEVVRDRVVIGKGSDVTAAVNIKDCEII